MRKATLALVTWVWLVVPGDGRAEPHGLLVKHRPAEPAGAMCSGGTTSFPASASTDGGPTCTPACQHGLISQAQQHHADVMENCQNGLLAQSYRIRTDPERKACKAEKRAHFLEWLRYQPQRCHCDKTPECCGTPPLYLFFLCADGIGCGSRGTGCGTCGGCR